MSSHLTTDLDTQSYRRMFPVLHLFRVFSIAADLRKVILAGIGLVVLALGQWGLSQLPFYEPGVHEWAFPWESNLGIVGAPRLATLGPELTDLVDRPGRTAEQLIVGWDVTLLPFRQMVAPATALIRFDNRLSTVATAITMLLWSLLVWSIFAGAMTRMAAMQFARGEKISIRSALRFSLRMTLSYLTAPILPFVGLAILWGLCALLGLIGRIPFGGPIAVGLLYSVPLVFGVLMTFAMLGLAVAWPLMFATISVEGSDAFDGLSRGYSYLFNRPWYYLGSTLLLMVYGSVVVFFVQILVATAVFVTGWAVAGGLGSEASRTFYDIAEWWLNPRQGNPAAMTEVGDQGLLLGGKTLAVWLCAVRTVPVAFVYSFFWSAVVAIYFLLRKSDDGNELSDVWLGEEEETDDLLPLVGTAASDQPVVERPVK